MLPRNFYRAWRRHARRWDAQTSPSMTSGTPGSRGEPPPARRFESSCVAVVTPALAPWSATSARRGVEPSPGGRVVENGRAASS